MATDNDLIGDTRARIARSGWLPVLGLFVLAPWMAEFSWGGMGLGDLGLALLFLGPLYGGAAIVIREAAQRTGRGWPTMLTLALAFGILQAGIVDQSLFNPSYGDYAFQYPAHVPGLDFSAHWLLIFAVGHVIASIGVPVALIESYAARRGDRPWLGRKGLALVTGIYVLGAAVNHIGVKEEEHFQATALQVSVAACAVVCLVVVAFALRPLPRSNGRVPRPLLLGGGALVLYALWEPRGGWAGVAISALLLAGTCWLVGRWSRRQEWATWHTFSLAAGAVLAGGWTAFTSAPYDETSAQTELVNDMIATAIPVVLVALGWWRLSRSGVPSDRHQIRSPDAHP